jgi:hypothetical protein
MPDEAEPPNIIERLQIRVVPRDSVPEDWHEISVPVHCADPVLITMWSTLKNCEAFGTLDNNYVTFWRRTVALTGKQLYRRQFGEPGRIETGCRQKR